MSVTTCPYCDTLYDQDTDVEHEEMHLEDEANNYHDQDGSEASLAFDQMMGNPMSQIDDLIQEAGEL